MCAARRRELRADTEWDAGRWWRLCQQIGVVSVVLSGPSPNQPPPLCPATRQRMSSESCHSVCMYVCVLAVRMSASDSRPGPRSTFTLLYSLLVCHLPSAMPTNQRVRAESTSFVALLPSSTTTTGRVGTNRLSQTCELADRKAYWQRAKLSPQCTVVSKL